MKSFISQRRFVVPFGAALEGLFVTRGPRAPHPATTMSRDDDNSSKIAEKLLQGGEVDALIRVLGADGARCLDATLSRVAVDEMARIKKRGAARKLWVFRIRNARRRSNFDRTTWKPTQK